MNTTISESETADARLEIDRAKFQQALNVEPFGLSHNLSELDLFSIDSLRSVASKYVDKKEYFVAGGAPKPDAKFYSVARCTERPVEAIDKIDQGSFRILLKRVDQHDDRFKKLLQNLFQQVIDLKGGLGNDRVERLESGVFISSSTTTTPFHFDPEVNFFMQIAGQKIYHVYSPTVVSEEELERFYFRGTVNIGQIPMEGRDTKKETVFNLAPGKGLHQPQNSPHWVETGAGLSISYSFVYETTETRIASRARAFNFYLRKLALNPSKLGHKPRVDGLKANTMRAVFGAYLPVRRAIGKTVRKVQK